MRIWSRTLRFAAFAILVLVALVSHAAKSPERNSPPTLPDPPTREQVRELVSRLSDAEVRKLLLQHLDRNAKESPKAKQGIVESLEEEMQRSRSRIGELLAALTQLPTTFRELDQRFEAERGPGHLATITIFTVLMLVLAYIVERLYRHAVRRQRAGLDQHPHETFGARVAQNVLRLLIDLGSVAVFGAAAVAAFYFVYQGHEPSRLVVLAVIGAALEFRLIALLSRFLLEPRAPALRLVPLHDRAAQRVQATVIQVGAIYLPIATLNFLLVRLGAPLDAASALALAGGIAGIACAIAGIWSVRSDIAQLIRGSDAASFPRRVMAELWAGAATVYLVVVYIALARDIVAGRQPEGQLVLSVLLLIALPIVDRFLTRALSAAMSGRATSGAGPATEHRSSFAPVLRKAVHIVVLASGVLMFASLWRVDLVGIAEHGLGEHVSASLLGIAIILLVAYLLKELAATLMARLELREGGVPAARTDDETSAAAATRLGTLLPLIRTTTNITILVVTVLSVLAALGVNVLPLLAGAGILGVAIGFGSQTLVRDIVSGAFFLADDAFRIGEYIEVGNNKGTVEKISIRSLFLRHHRGALGVLPYGEIKSLRNQSRDWVIDKLTVGITYDSDIEKARKLVKKIGQQLAENPEYADKILEPLKMQGVEQFGDFAIQVRMKMKTKPNEQYVIRRKAYALIKKSFDENGIKFAFPTVQIAGGTEAPQPAMAAAASAALAATRKA